MAMDTTPDESTYNFEIQENGAACVIGTRPLFDALIHDIQKGHPASIISKRFHNGLIAMFSGLAENIRDRTSLNRVCLSGGTFHNTYLLENLTKRLRSKAFEVFTHGEVPAGDGGLSLGQALVAAHRCK
jgi:hydrogenase maturation protein HypF